MTSEVRVVRAILHQNQYLLRRHLILSKTVLDELRSEGLITDTIKRKITLEPVHKQIPVLLGTIENKGLTSFRKFLDVLRRTGHGWLVEQLLDTDVTMGAVQGRFATDDIGHRDGFQSQYTRPHALTSTAPYPGAGGGLGGGSLGARGGGGVSRRQGLLDNYFRHAVTAGPSTMMGADRNDVGLSLASLLKAREPPDPSTAPRGVIHARSFLNEQEAAPSYLPFHGNQMPMYAQGGQSIMPFPRMKEDIPMTLYGLNQAFADQEQKHQHAMSVLRQEETAIRQLMEQNARDQGQVRQKQAVVKDISNRLRDIHLRATDVYKPSPNPNIGQYRLNQLNQIPWSIDN